MEEVDVAVIGAGPGGLAAAVSLSIADPSLKIKVFEKASALRPAGFVVGILPNALKAIKAMDESLYASCIESLTPADSERGMITKDNTGSRVLASMDGNAVLERYNKYGGGLYPVAWYDLQQFWAGKLPEGALQIGATFERFEQSGDGVDVHFKDGRACKAKLLIGADGNMSGVRAQLLGDGLPRFAGVAVWRAMREMPEEWPVQGGMLSFVDDTESRTISTMALSGGRMTWIVAVPWAQEELPKLSNKRYITVDGGVDEAKSGHAGKLNRCLEALQDVDGGYPGFVMDMLASTPPESITEHPLFYREPEDCHCYARGRVALLGDAAHLTAAALGQGTSQTMEDALELGRAVALHGLSPEALTAYEAARRGPAGEVQKKSAELVKLWGKLKEPRGPVDQRASEKFFSRTFEPMPRALNGHRRGAPAPFQAAMSATRRDGCSSGKRTHAPRQPGPLPGGLLARV